MKLTLKQFAILSGLLLNQTQSMAENFEQIEVRALNSVIEDLPETLNIKSVDEMAQFLFLNQDSLSLESRVNLQMLLGNTSEDPEKFHWLTEEELLSISMSFAEDPVLSIPMPMAYHR